MLSGARPFDRATWALEVFPVVLVVPVLWATYRSHPLTSLLYACIFVHALVLMLGGAYTYARVPLGFQIAERSAARATRTTRSATSSRASCPPWRPVKS